jgi:alanine-synthesizing transaminase
LVIVDFRFICLVIDHCQIDNRQSSMFSSRTPANLSPNRLALAVRDARRAGRPLIDLTQSNPTRAGLNYPPDLLDPLADVRGLVYAPEPFGVREARTAVAAEYERAGVSVEPGHIVLTASTSEAYSLLFKILCDAGDEVLVPRPSYPLFEHLARLDAVTATPYDLEYHGRWSIDFAMLERVLSPRSRALLVVSPNNPTGSFIGRDEAERLTALAAAHHVAVIADEVFAEYELVPGARSRGGRVLAGGEALRFALGGLSKSVGLPQMKLAWIAVSGPADLAADALERLEIACDTYLSVSTPVQAAAPELLRRGADLRRQIQRRIAANYDALAAAAAGSPACGLLEAEGGWYAVLQVPSFGSEEDLALDLLVGDGVLVHPGYFFDFPRESFLIVSLLVPESEFMEGVGRVLRYFDCSAGRP